MTRDTSRTNRSASPTSESDSLASDDRAVSEVLAVTLLIGIVVVGMSTILLVAGTQLSGSQDAVEVSQAERALTQFDSEASHVGTGGTSSRTVDLGLRGNSGTLDTEPESGHITVKYLDNIGSSSWTEVTNTSLGTVVYENGETTVGYQGGGVWRSDGEGSMMVSPPEVTFAEETLTMPIIKSERGGSVHSDLRIRSSGDSETTFPNATDDNLTNKVNSGTVWITIESQYYEAWGRYFEDQVNTQVIYHPGEEKVSILFYGSKMNFSPEAGVIATSGPGELRVQGSGSYIDSYNSSVGPYSDTATNEGSVRSAGDVQMEGGSEIRGNTESNQYVNLSGGAEITGNVSAEEGWETDGTSDIHGETDYNASVPILPPLDSYVEAKAEEFTTHNDNNETAVIENNRLNFDDSNELSSGEYYLEEVRLNDGETLVFNASEGDITVVVENYVVLDEGNFEIEGGDEAGTVRLIVASEESSGETVQGTGGEPADHFYVQGDSQITVENDSSPRFQVLAPARFTGGIRASGSDNAQVTGTIVAPTVGEGPGQFIVRDAELFGSVVTGDFTAENKGQVHFDHAIMGEEIPFGEGVSLLDYFYLTEHRIEIEGR